MDNFVKTHALLGDDFYVPVVPATAPSLTLRYRNQRAADAIGIGALSDADWRAHFGNFTPFAGSFERPLALAYHGHQFGHYNPDIGDGRGFLFAQLQEPETGRLLDFGTKGTGQTPFSRQGDGCLTLKGAVREVLATELLTALGVSTSQTLSVIETGRALTRHDEPSPTRSAVLVRLSHSHIRIGTFQRHLYLKNPASNERLARYVVRHYYPGRDDKAPLPELIGTLLSDLAHRVAVMAGGWMAAGFVHGVLNTDNFNMTGESFDYGPWRFLPHLDPNFTAAYFDETSRYAYGRQPDAALWALCRLADCFVESVGKAVLEQALEPFFAHMEEAMVALMMRRLGLKVAPDGPDKTAHKTGHKTAHKTGHETGVAIMNALLKAARETKCPFDEMFFDLYGGVRPDKDIYRHPAFAAYFEEVAALPEGSALSRAHPYFEKGRIASLVIEEVERVWAPIAQDDDWSCLSEKLDDIRCYGAALARYDGQI